MSKKVLSLEEQIEESTKNMYYKEVEGTPFLIVGDEDKKQYFGAVGEYRLTEFYDKPGLAEKEVTRMNWENVARLMTVLIDKNNKTKLVTE